MTIIDWDMIFYLYCIKLKRTQKEFWNAPFTQILTMIEIDSDEKTVKSCLMANKPYESKYFGTSAENKKTSRLRDIL